MRTFSIADVSNINAKPAINFSGTLSGDAPFNLHVMHIISLMKRLRATLVSSRHSTLSRGTQDRGRAQQLTARQ
jgi:hypothetical protein